VKSNKQIYIGLFGSL